MSLKVGEHIAPSSTSQFLSLLDRHCKIGIIISWAVPGQGGHGHINELPTSRIMEHLLEKGYYQNDWTNKFQNEARESASYPWFKKSVLVFLKN